MIIIVEDNGPGIPEAERENVFRPFYRLDHARNQASGRVTLHKRAHDRRNLRPA